MKSSHFGDFSRVIYIFLNYDKTSCITISFKKNHCSGQIFQLASPFSFNEQEQEQEKSVLAKTHQGRDMDAEIEESGWQTCYSLHHSLNTIHGIPYTIHCTPYTVLFTMYTVHCSLYTVHHTLDTVHCTLFTIHCSLYSVYCKLNTIHLKKKCPFCREKLLNMEVKESMNKVHNKVPVKLVEYTLRIMGKKKSKNIN